MRHRLREKNHLLTDFLSLVFQNQRWMSECDREMELEEASEWKKRRSWERKKDRSHINGLIIELHVSGTSKKGHSCLCTASSLWDREYFFPYVNLYTWMSFYSPLFQSILQCLRHVECYQRFNSTHYQVFFTYASHSLLILNVSIDYLIRTHDNMGASTSTQKSVLM